MALPSSPLPTLQPACLGHQQHGKPVEFADVIDVEKAIEIAGLPTLLHNNICKSTSPDDSHGVPLDDNSVGDASSNGAHPLLQSAPGIANCISFVYADVLLGLTSPIPRCQDLPLNSFRPLRADDVLVSVSHGWKHQGHPDPTGEKLSVLKRHIKKLKDSLTTRQPRPEIVVFLDFLSITQRPFAAGQQDRTEQEQEIFLEALQLMHWVYLKSDHVIHIDVPVSDIPDHGELYRAGVSEDVSFHQVGSSFQVSRSASPVIGIFDEIIDVGTDGEVVFQLDFTDDWAAKMQSKLEDSLLQGKGSIRAIDKYGSRYDIHRTGEHVQLDPIPDRASFPLEFETVDEEHGAPSSNTGSLSMEALKKLQCSKTRTTAMFRKLPYGKCNPIPVHERGWVFLERFITAAKIACIGDKSLKTVCITESEQVLQWMRESARLLRKSFANKSGSEELFENLAGWKDELSLKKFSAASVDKQKLVAETPKSAERAVVATLMNEVCERLLMERESEISQQRARADQQSATLRILSAGSTSLLDFLFGPPKFEMNPDLLSTARGEMQIRSSHSPGYLILQFVTWTLVGSAVAAYLGFGLMPMHDIRQDAAVKYWYECALSCSVIFTPLLIGLAAITGNSGFFRPVLGCPLGLGFVCKAVVSAAWLPIPIIYVTANFLAYPATWIMVPSFHTISMIVIHTLMLFELPYGQRKKHSKTILLLGAFNLLWVLYACFIIGIAGLSSFLSSLDNVFASVLATVILPFARSLGGKSLVLLGAQIHPTLALLAVFWACMIFALVAPLAMGSTSALFTAVGFAFIDLFMELLALLGVAQQDVQICGWTLAHEDYVLLASTPIPTRILRKTGLLAEEVVSRDLIRQCEGRWLVYYLSLEQAAFLAPLLVLTLWSILFFSKNGESFAGIGVDEFGWFRPDSMDGTEVGRVFTLYTNTGTLIVLNTIFVMFINKLFKRKYKLQLAHAQAWILEQYRWELCFFVVFGVYELFCGLMLACGLDISFQMKPLLDPWDWFSSDTLPQAYVNRGFPASRP